MTIAFVLGNGISRQHLNLAHLKNCGMIYGCNALYREFTPDVLVATDRPISEAIQHAGYALANKFYTRRPLPELGALKVRSEYHGYSSGPNAVALAAQDHHHVYLLGFDMGPTQHKGFNNIYADTEFYKKSSANPTFTGNWVTQLKSIMKSFSNTNFFRIVGNTTAETRDLLGVPNLAHVQMADFQNRLNTKQI